MQWNFSRPQVMGILNVTPDSFSDGGQYTTLDRALWQVEKMISEGADIVDVGGESTRPGASDVSEQEEIDRVVPIIEAVRQRFPIPISVDTNKAGVMRGALAVGASLINDVRALQETGALDVAINADVPVCLMHMQGAPRTMQNTPQYDDVVNDVLQFLSQRVDVCIKAGIPKQRLMIDPGFGFGKTVQHNLILLKELKRFEALGLPIMVGLSRKTMIGKVLDKPVEQRLYGSLAGAVLAVWQGASIIRVHDVAATVDAVRFCHAVMQEAPHP